MGWVLVWPFGLAVGWVGVSLVIWKDVRGRAPKCTGVVVGSILRLGFS